MIDISFCASVTVVDCPHLHPRSFGMSWSVLGLGVLYREIPRAVGAWPKTSHFSAVSFLEDGLVSVMTAKSSTDSVVRTGKAGFSPVSV